MNTISVIIPIFHGKQYIRSLLHQVEEAQKQIGKNWEIQTIFVNDAPDDFIADSDIPEKFFFQGNHKILILNVDQNHGVHGARVWGLEHAEGEFVLFLDQDDQIAPEYFASQIKRIEDNDAVVCQVFHENKLFYNTDYPFEYAVSKEFMLKSGCPIISPGQVLLRKTAISEVWKKNIMVNNGADDFLLWLCMVGERKKFALNENVVFTHTVHYGNASWDSERMLASEKEIGQILKRARVFDEEDERLLEQMLQRIYRERLKKLDKFRKMFYLLSDWQMIKENGGCITQFLLEQGVYSVAVYGMGRMGRLLIKELEHAGIRVLYLIDKNAKYIETEYKTYTPGDELEKLEPVDAVLISLVQEEQAVADEMKRHLNVRIFTIGRLIQKAGEGIKIW